VREQHHMASRALSSGRRLYPKVGRAYYSTNQTKPTSATQGEIPPVFIEYPRPSIGEYRYGVPAPTGPKHITRQTKVTTLPNGLRVASLTSNDLVRTVGLYVAAGSRDETRSTAGINHVLKYAAFGSTATRPAYQLARELEAAGATLNATSGREHMLFTSEFPPTSVDTVVPIVSDLLHPRLSYHEVHQQKVYVQEDTERLEADPVGHILELLHRQAYRSRGLGQPLTANKHDVHRIARGNVANWVHENYVPNKAVIVGVGFEHEELVKSVEAAFANQPERKRHDNFADDHHGEQTHVEPEATHKQVGKYHGGEVLQQAAGHTYFAIGFEGASLTDAKLPAYGVLQFILGSVLNGNAGSQIGSGITARLAKNVLPSNQGATVLSAFNFSYTDSGLFGVYAETASAPGRLAQQITAELAKLRTPLSAEELARGKAAHKLSLLDLKRGATLEFIGAQVLAGGKAVTPEEYAAQIDAVTAEDVAAVAKKLLSSRPTLVALGDVTQLPSAEELSSVLKSQ
jgi:processing peptidase subunit alpha